LHLQEDDGILDLELALLETAHQQLVGVGFLSHPLDHLVEAAMLELQLGDPQLDGVCIVGSA
jgi:hypothetical protein